MNPIWADTAGDQTAEDEAEPGRQRGLVVADRSQGT